MIINEEQKNTVINNPLFTDIKCPVCANSVLILTDRIFEIREFFGGKLELGGNSNVIPVISLVCEQCGYILFFNAVKLGLIKPKQAKKQAPMNQAAADE